MSVIFQLLIRLPLSILLIAFVIQCFFKWFIAPLGVPLDLTLGQAAGIGFCLSLLTSNAPRLVCDYLEDPEGFEDRQTLIWIMSCVNTVIVLVLGFLLHLAMMKGWV